MLPPPHTRAQGGGRRGDVQVAQMVLSHLARVLQEWAVTHTDRQGSLPSYAAMLLPLNQVLSVLLRPESSSSVLDLDLGAPAADTAQLTADSSNSLKHQLLSGACLPGLTAGDQRQLVSLVESLQYMDKHAAALDKHAMRYIVAFDYFKYTQVLSNSCCLLLLLCTPIAAAVCCCCCAKDRSLTGGAHLCRITRRKSQTPDRGQAH